MGNEKVTGIKPKSGPPVYCKYCNPNLDGVPGSLESQDQDNRRLPTALEILDQDGEPVNDEVIRDASPKGPFLDKKVPLLMQAPKPHFKSVQDQIIVLLETGSRVNALQSG